MSVNQDSLFGKQWTVLRVVPCLDCTLHPPFIVFVLNQAIRTIRKPSKPNQLGRDKATKYSNVSSITIDQHKRYPARMLLLVKTNVVLHISFYIQI